MSVAELVRGPNHGQPPDFTGATITRAKLEGVTPGLFIKDKAGDTYIIKFDNKEYPELQSGAEVISTKILYAAGYNVPENYISRIDPKSLEIDSELQFDSGAGKRAFTKADLEKMLANAARKPDGGYRVLASTLLKGKPKGPFPYVGLRVDDPNDRIPHEHRRELRGLRVIASWINHWDLKEGNTLDTYVEEGGRKFVRHHLIDFGSSLGGGKSPMEYFHGREYSFDGLNLFKEVATLGLYVTPDEKKAPLVFPEVGIFSANDFNPGGWRPSVRVLPFTNMTQADAFWATRIIMAFSAEELADIVKTAEYTNPEVSEYMLRTLLERRRLIAEHWLEDVNPLSNFALDTQKDGVSLKFDDLAAKHDLGRRAEYRYELSRGSEVQRATTTTPVITLGPIAGEVRLKIWTTRDGESSSPVTIIAHDKPNGGFGIFRIARS